MGHCEGWRDGACDFAEPRDTDEIFRAFVSERDHNLSADSRQRFIFTRGSRKNTRMMDARRGISRCEVASPAIYHIFPVSPNVYTVNTVNFAADTFYDCNKTHGGGYCINIIRPLLRPRARARARASRPFKTKHRADLLTRSREFTNFALKHARGYREAYFKVKFITVLPRVSP